MLDKQLAGNAFVAGEEYTIADMSIFPWAARHEWHTVNLADFPNVKRWYETVMARPGTKRGFEVSQKPVTLFTLIESLLDRN